MCDFDEWGYKERLKRESEIKKETKLEKSKIHKEIATRLFMTCTEFAKAHSISRSTVSGWGNGKNISPDHCKLLHGLGISQEAIENPCEKVNP